MLNRRQVRRKVLQHLYAFKQQDDSNQGANDTLASYDKKLQASFNDFYQLFLLQLDTLIKVKRNVETKIDLEKKKYSTSVKLLNKLEFIANNTVLNHLESNILLTDKLSKLKYRIDIENIQFIEKLTTALLDMDIFEDIDFSDPEKTKSIENFVIDFFDVQIAQNEEMHDMYLQNNINWADDTALVNTMTLKYLKSIKKSDDEYQKLPSSVSNKETTDFGRKLFIKTLNRWDDLDKIIDAEIKNWELERLAFLDLLIIKMAITEFYDFIEIPLRVTINEYIEVAKDYSSPKSSKFINGVLDKIQNTLINNKEITKQKS